MKRLIFKSLVLIPLLLASLTSSAQEESKSQNLWDRLVCDAGLSAGLKNNGMFPTSIYVNLGYKFVPQFYAFANLELVSMKHNTREHGRGEYMVGNALGLGLGYSLYAKDKKSIDVRGIIGTSVGGFDFYKYTKYDAQLLWKITGKETLGIGFKHMNSRVEGVKHYNGVYGIVSLDI